MSFFIHKFPRFFLVLGLSLSLLLSSCAMSSPEAISRGSESNIAEENLVAVNQSEQSQSNISLVKRLDPSLPPFTTESSDQNITLAGNNVTADWCRTLAEDNGFSVLVSPEDNLKQVASGINLSGLYNDTTLQDFCLPLYLIPLMLVQSVGQVHFMESDEIEKEYGLVHALVDGNQTLHFSKASVSTGVLHHELTHTWFKKEDAKAGKRRLWDEFWAASAALDVLPEGPERDAVEEEFWHLSKALDDFPEHPYLLRWRSVAGDVYGKGLQIDEEGYLYWASAANSSAPGAYGPKWGIMNPQGAEKPSEDIGTFIESIIIFPETFAPLLNKSSQSYDPRYRKKLDLLLEFGFITIEHHGVVINASGVDLD